MHSTKRLGARRWGRLIGVGAGALVAGLMLAPGAAQAASPGCTVATATPIALNSANVHSSVCPGLKAYNYIDMAAGDVVTIDFDARSMVDTYTEAYVEIYAPGVTDFTIGSTEQIYANAVPKGGMEQGTYRAYESGRFIVLWKHSRGIQFTPRLAVAPKQAGRVNGGCRIESAPVAASGVLQYSDSDTCSTQDRFWKFYLRAGDTLTVPVTYYGGGWWDTNFYVYEPGVTDYTLGQTQHWCYFEADDDDPQWTGRCGKALKTGWYVIHHTDGRAAFRPIRTAPPAIVRVSTDGPRNRLIINVDPNKGPGSWTFRVHKRVSASRWTTLPATHRTEGPGETKVLNLGKGTYRVVVAAQHGYRTSTSRAVTLVR